MEDQAHDSNFFFFSQKQHHDVLSGHTSTVMTENEKIIIVSVLSLPQLSKLFSGVITPDSHRGNCKKSFV